MENPRLKQLRKLIADSFSGSQTALANRSGVSLAQIGQYLGGYRNIGEKTARKFEQAANKPVGWLDGFDSNVIPASIGTRRIPLISHVQAGTWSEICDNFEPGDAEEWLLTDLKLSRCAFSLAIQGDSMTPDFNAGDKVIIEPEIAPRPGDFVVARNGDQEATFKKYRSRGIDATGQEIIELIPLNQDYPTISSTTSKIEIVGVMVEHRRYRKH